MGELPQFVYAVSVVVRLVLVCFYARQVPKQHTFFGYVPDFV